MKLLLSDQMTVATEAKKIAGVDSLTDMFTDDRKPGRVIGSRSETGYLRLGVDRENCISIDNDALRIQPLRQVGWGRAGIAYEAYRRQPGLALAVYMLNGHNTSQCGALPESLGSRMKRWWIGSETYERDQRIIRWIRSGRIARTVRQFRWWFHLHWKTASLPTLDENLALGWFSREVPDSPLNQGDAFMMHATGPENGELWATVGGNALAAIRSVQNVQIYYVIVLREKGAAFYVASVKDANGLGRFPEMRPVAIDPFNSDEVLYPGVHQSVLGQIGFRLDTRVYGVRVEQLDDFAVWYGSAHAADRLEGAVFAQGALAEVGGSWKVWEADGSSLGILDPGRPSGLIHLLCQPDSHEVVGVVWRFQDLENYWRLQFDGNGCRLVVRIGGEWSEVAASDTAKIHPGMQNSIQVLDDGDTMSFHLGGELLFGTRFRDLRLRFATGVGICCTIADTSYDRFEAHPRSVPIPPSLHMGAPWFQMGSEILVADDFSGGQCDLDGRLSKVGQKVWRRQIGSGRMEVTGVGSVKIKATAKQPNPGRTAYMLDWDNPNFADVSVEITPPGTGPGQGEHGLCGFILWQDPDNYITINIWVNEYYGGASISCFFHVDGFEDLYDAIWSNIGKRVYYGVPVVLRVVINQEKYMVFVNEEPVIFRRLSDVYSHSKDFAVRRVGLMANWEWGNDTGSIFRDFVGRV